MWWIEYDVAGVALAVSNAVGDPNVALKPASCVTLEVEDLDAALAELRASGAPISRNRWNSRCAGCLPPRTPTETRSAFTSARQSNAESLVPFLK